MNTTLRSLRPGAVSITLLRIALAGVSLVAVGSLAACSQAQDDASTSSQDIYGYTYDGPNVWNTHVIGTIGYGQTQSALGCLNQTIQHASAIQYRPGQKYCALKFTGSQFDKIRLTVSNKDSWGTDQIEAYVFDDRFNLANPDAASESPPLGQDKFEGDHNGNNTGKPVELSLTAGRQLTKTETYYVVFTKYAVRDNNGLTKYKNDDAFTIRLDAVKSSDLPISLDHPPVRSGLYTTAGGDFVIDVTPPAPPASGKDFSAWRAHVFAKRTSCQASPAVNDYADVDCNENGCWFYASSRSLGAGVTATGNWYLSPEASGAVSYAGYRQSPVKMQRVRDVSDVELHAYETQDGCKLQCPAPSPTSPNYANPCGGSGGPGWCYPGWVAPFGFESPLVFNLGGGNNIEFLGRTVPFNLDGTGSHPLDWVAPAHPFLALDINGNDVIDDGTELFGTSTVLGTTHQTAANGFEALGQYDDNGDKKIDAKDAIYNRLVLWFDKNSNGVSDPGELSPFSFSGIDAINLNAARQPAPATSSAGGFIAYTSSFDEHVCSPAISMFVADVWFPTSR